MKKLSAVIGVILSIIYLLNLTFGVIEIPDNLPIIGNIDEVIISSFLFGCLRYLGLDLIPFKNDNSKKQAS